MTWKQDENDCWHLFSVPWEKQLDFFSFWFCLFDFFLILMFEEIF